jgi:tetratricopeptide (TPR) repeat protein
MGNKKKILDGDVQQILDKAAKFTDEADSREKVVELAEMYEHALKIDPDNRTALAALGSCNFLLGYGYADNTDDKEIYYLRAIRACERLLYLNPDFKARADQGEKIWDAVDVFTVGDMEALWWYYVAVGNYWTECHSMPVKLINLAWPSRAKTILTRMLEIDPGWQHGSPYYMWGIYYAKVPSIAGGDIAKSQEMFNKAIDTGPTMLNFRRSRARFLYVQTGNRESFIRDMEWVLQQDPHKAPLGYHWNVFIQRDARKGLKDIDNLF